MGRIRTAGTAAFLATGGFLFGYDLVDSGIISSTIAQPYFIEYMGTPTASEKGGIVSSFTGGAILGSIAVSWSADRLGRKMTILIGAIVSTVRCALRAGAVNVPMIIAGRLIAGISVGLLAATVPMYCSEIAIAEDRGTLAGMLQFLLSWGFFVAQWLGYGCFQLVPSLILLIGCWWLVESPRWLMEKDRSEEARAILASLHGTGDNQEFLDAEFIEIRDVIAAERAAVKASWKEMITKKSWRKRLILGCGIQAFGQLSGINVINYYGPQIYELLGIGPATSLKLTGISGTLSLVETAGGLYILDKIGRIKPLVIGSFAMFTFLLIEAVLGHFYVVGKDINSESISGGDGAALRAMIAMQFLVSLAFVFIGTTSWVYPSEIFPIEIRARGNSLAATTNWCLNLIFAQTAPIALESININFFYLFAAFNFIAAICYWVFYPETKGKTLEELDAVSAIYSC